MSLPPEFKINRADVLPFKVEVLKGLPLQQQVLERAIGGTKYVSRTVRALANETGLNPEQVQEYCEASAHIARSPVPNSDGSAHFGHIVRLREKYYESESGEFVLPNLDSLAARSGRIYDIFLSYAHEDASIASELRKSFERAGLLCFMAEKSLRAGDDWSDEIREALGASTFVVLLLTQRSKGKRWLQHEVGAAWALRKKIVPALNQVEFDELTEPIARSHGRKVETAAERRKFAKELAERKL
jgi:TIR domain